MRSLARNPKLSDLHLSADGSWVLFIDRSAGASGLPGGSVYLAPTGSDDARVVLRATPARSFAAPIPRPAR